MKVPQPTLVDIPIDFLDRMVGLLGEEYPSFVKSLQNSAVTGFRVNPLKMSIPEFLARSPWQLSPVPWCSSGFIFEPGEYIQPRVSPGRHPYHAAGLYYIQEPSAMAAAEVLAPQPGEKVLDLAAAPGGKATHLAALMNNTGLLLANEIHPKRVYDLAENLERCGVTNAVVSNETPQRLADFFGESFDRVLLDAPCSGEGMFRKGEIARWEWKSELVRSCAMRQLAILNQAAGLVTPGGRLAYTTCTFSPDENEGVIAKFLAQHPEFDLETIQPTSGFRPARPDWIGLSQSDRLNKAVRIWPHLARGEGHFIALLVKYTPEDKYAYQAEIRRKPRSRIPAKSRSSSLALELVDEFCKDNLSISFDHSRLAIDAASIHLLPEGAPDCSDLHLIHPGWWLGSIHKGRFTPSHSLAMGMKSNQAVRSIHMQPDDPQLMSYFAGESFSNTGDNGWVLITVDGCPVGWTKRVNNVLKNYYPHGLRRHA